MTEMKAMKEKYTDSMYVQLAVKCLPKRIFWSLTEKPIVQTA